MRAMSVVPTRATIAGAANSQITFDNGGRARLPSTTATDVRDLANALSPDARCEAERHRYNTEKPLAEAGAFAGCTVRRPSRPAQVWAAVMSTSATD
jgi:hypothetical protein